jgi:hypothetical protein
MNTITQGLQLYAKFEADSQNDLVEPRNPGKWLNNFSNSLIKLTVLEVLSCQKVLRDEQGLNPWNLEIAVKEHFNLQEL